MEQKSRDREKRCREWKKKEMPGNGAQWRDGRWEGKEERDGHALGYVCKWGYSLH